MVVTRSKKQKEKASQPCLPREIIFEEILPWVPARSLVRFRCVCKLWRRTIATPDFVNAHLRRWSRPRLPCRIIMDELRNQKYYCVFDPETADCFDMRLRDCLKEDKGVLIVPKASCDGLLVVLVLEEGATISSRYYICNPVTRRSERLPIPPGRFEACELVYDSAIQRYKIVGWTDMFRGKCVLITLGRSSSKRSLGSWRVLAKPLPKKCYLMSWLPPAFAAGILYWGASKKGNIECIISMDVKKEEFNEEIKLPQPLDRYQSQSKLVEAKGLLYLVYPMTRDSTYRDIWVLQKNVWTKLCSIDGFGRSNRVRKYVDHDIETLEEVWRKTVEIEEYYNSRDHVNTHINSLVNWGTRSNKFKGDRPT